MKLHKLFSDRLGRRGIAAVEFALIIPVLLVLFIGTIEVLTLYRT
jgi:Flp pilus assembly protein TadG